MSESRTTCPLCERPPGGVHQRGCGRGRVRMLDLAKGTKIVKHLHRHNFVWRSGTLVTAEELVKLQEEHGDGIHGRPAWYRSKRPGDRARRIEAHPKDGAPIPMLYVAQQGTYRKAG